MTAQNVINIIAPWALLPSSITTLCGILGILILVASAIIAAAPPGRFGVAVFGIINAGVMFLICGNCNLTLAQNNARVLLAPNASVTGVVVTKFVFLPDEHEVVVSLPGADSDSEDSVKIEVSSYKKLVKAGLHLPCDEGAKDAVKIALSTSYQ
jgi:hypothetical protein